jgi:drug/metabolite transporter (DMT)-like permease
MTVQPHALPATSAAPRAWLGTALMTFSAICYGITPIFARYAYEGGSTPLALLAFRYLLVAGLLLTVALLRGRAVTLPKGQRRAGILFGVIFTLASWGFLSAIRTLPVSLAVLIFFSHPIIVVLASRCFGGASLGAARAIAVVSAFAGLALALGVSPGLGIGGLDPHGLAFSALSTGCYAAMLLFGGRVVRRSDAMTLNLNTMTIAAALCLPAAILAGDFVLPATAQAWLGVGGLILTYLLGVVTFFAALDRIGPSRTAMLSYVEPIVSILGAVFVLGETLTIAQTAGIAVMVGALTIMARPPASP